MIYHYIYIAIKSNLFDNLLYVRLIFFRKLFNFKISLYIFNYFTFYCIFKLKVIKIKNFKNY